MKSISSYCTILLVLGNSGVALAEEAGNVSLAAKAEGTAPAAVKLDGTASAAEKSEETAPAAAKSEEADSASKSDAKDSSADSNARTRKNSLSVANTLDGTTGLLRVMSADSSDPGTFRLSATGTFYKGSGFLCPNCADVNGRTLAGSDSVGYSAFRLQASITPLSFLEAWGSMRFRSVSNDLGAPRVIQASGDTMLGAKAFMPYRKGRVFTFGGGLQLSLLAKNRSVGLGMANVDLMTAGTFDFRELSDASGIPLRAHLNLGYRFDNTGSIADDIEAGRTQRLGPNNRITRVERFGFGVNRTDSIRIGLGAEWVTTYLRPFVEWSIDVSANRQGYKCRVGSTTLGDTCLDRTRELAALPSRLSLGVRGYPWNSTWAEGVMLLLAADIGTGATSKFVEELTPELPWAITVGLGYSGGAKVEVEHVVEEKKVEVAQPLPPELFVMGKITEKDSSTPIGGVAVQVKDGSNAVLSDERGAFRTFKLDAGKIVLHLKKEGYAESDCEVMVMPATVKPPAQASAKPGDQQATATAPHERLEVPTEVQCSLVRLPAVGTVTGVLRDADTTEYVSHASVVVLDPKGRKASLETDEYGGFRFEKVPAGAIKMQMSADGYLASGAEITVKAREDSTVQLTLHKRPRLATVTVTKNELKLKRQIHFSHDSADIMADSQGIVDEIAEALRNRPDIAQVEIQGHTDDTGSAEHNLTLSTKRANAVRDALVRIGIEPNRLTARGYGQDKPLVRAKTPAAREKNRRVQLMIVGL